MQNSTPSSALSVLICTYRAPASLDLLFDSLARQAWQPGDEVVLIDNGMEPERVAQVRRRLEDLGAQGVKGIYAREERTGLTYARLAGFQLLHHDWVLLLDDDNSLREDALSNLRRCISTHPGLGGICPRIEPIWETPVPNWVIALGHDVLSYNASSLYGAPFAWKQWEPGRRGLRPPGGGMIIRKSAIDRFIHLTRNFSFVGHLGHRGAALGSGEDFLLYAQVYQLGLPTAYDGSIVVQHRIPAERVRLSYLCRLLYRANFGFALVALMVAGKILFLPSIGHGVLRLGGRLAVALRQAPSPQVVLAIAIGFGGYLAGTLRGLLIKDLKKIDAP